METSKELWNAKLLCCTRKTSRLPVVHIMMPCAVLMSMLAVSNAQQLVSDPLIQSNVQDLNQIGSAIGNITQMCFGPDGKLYVSTFGQGIKRFDYDPNGNISNGTTVWSRPANVANGAINGSLGIAFHVDQVLGHVMYIAPAVRSNFNVEVNYTQSILRLTDSDGDGNWGELSVGEVNQAIVDNLRVTDLHQVNQLIIEGDTLFAGIGSRTRSGGNQDEYPGAVNPDDGEFAYTGSINWIRDLKQLSTDTITSNLAGFAITSHHSDIRPLTSSETGKLTVYSTGFRNVYGLALDGDGQLWATMNQNETPLKPDELHRTDFKDDHQFPKENESSGNWKEKVAALNAGFFQHFEEPVALLGNHASANGLDFTDINDAFAGHAFITRFAAGNDLIAVDPSTGSVRQIVTGLSNPIDVLTDPYGHLLIGNYGSGGRILRLRLYDGKGRISGDLDSDGFVNTVDWEILRSNFHADLFGLPPQAAYQRGDLNGDYLNDGLDFALFKKAYQTANGSITFERLIRVPEPTGFSQAAIAASLAAISSRRRSRSSLADFR